MANQYHNFLPWLYVPGARGDTRAMELLRKEDFRRQKTADRTLELEHIAGIAGWSWVAFVEQDDSDFQILLPPLPKPCHCRHTPLDRGSQGLDYGTQVLYQLHQLRTCPHLQKLGRAVAKKERLNLN